MICYLIQLEAWTRFIHESYNVFNLSLGFQLNKNLKCRLAINNLLNEEYSPHTSRIRGVAEITSSIFACFYISIWT